MVSFITIVTADDHPTFRDGLGRLLEIEPDLKVIAQANYVADAINRVLELKPDILLLDLKMPPQPKAEISPRGGLDALAAVKGSGSMTKTILFSAEIETEEIIEAIKLGARGVLLKSAATELLIEGIRTVMRGACWAGTEAVPTFDALLRKTHEEVNKRKFGLTPRELEVVSAIVRHSMSNKDIAQLFKIAEDTVKHHVFNSCEKVGASNRLELGNFARAHKLPLKDLF